MPESRFSSVTFTGLTAEDFKRRVKEFEHRHLEGLAPGHERRCYLCKRLDGTQSASMGMPGDEVLFSKLDVETYGIEVGSTTFCFQICSECIILLTGLQAGKIQTNDK
jgi:hypothetical protein